MFTDPWDIIEAELTLPDVDTLFIYSTGDVSTSGTFVSDSIFVKIEESPADITLSFDVRYLEVNFLSGTATVLISGTGDMGRFYVSAYGMLDSKGFNPLYTVINSNCTNNCYIGSGSRLLDAVITNVGNVYYVGDPVNLNSVITGSGRLIRLEVNLLDVPGSLNKLLGIIADEKANILHIFHDRLDLQNPIDVSRVILNLETRGHDHAREVVARLRDADYGVKQAFQVLNQRCQIHLSPCDLDKII
jgi:hypothetical protein